MNLKVWGDQWGEPLSRLVGIETAPGKILRGWGKPVWVRGDVELVGTRATLRAIGVPAHQFVELRTLIARSAFTSTDGMRVERGDAFDRIVQEELADADRYARDHDRIDALKAHPIRTALVVLGLATIPALLIIAAVFWFMGRERRTGYDREYEQEPPTDTEPALVPTLLRQGGEAGSYEFTATLFDLVRRGVYKAVPTTTERPIWGGLRHETVSDLELSAGKDGELRAWERDVANVVDGVLDGGSERLSRFRDQIEDERETMHGRFTAFKEHVADEAGRLSWFRSTGAIPLVVAVVLFALVGGLLVFFAVRHWRPVYPRYSDILLVGIGACMIANAALCLGTLDLQPPRCGAVARRPGRRRPSAGRRSGATSPTSRGCRKRRPRRSRSGSATSSTASRSESPSACCRERNCTCRRPSTRRAPSTGSHRGATSAQARRACRSATSRPGSEALSLHRTRDPVGSAAASREAAEGAAAGAAAGSAERAASSRPVRPRPKEPSGAERENVAP